MRARSPWVAHFGCTHTPFSKSIPTKDLFVRQSHAEGDPATAVAAARELGCAPGVPCFRSDRVSTDAESHPIVYDRVFIPGDRFRITRQLHYDRSATA